MAKASASDAADNGCWRKHIQVIGLTAGLLGIVAALVISVCFGRAATVEDDLKGQDTRLQAVERDQAAQKERDKAILASLDRIEDELQELRKRDAP